MSTFSAVALAAFLTPVLALLATIHTLLSWLSANRPDVYDQLGRPHLFLNNTPAHTKALRRFVLKGGHKQLDEAHVNKLCRVARILYWVDIVMLVMYVVVFVFSIGLR